MKPKVLLESMVKEFTKPKVDLEQYRTPAETALELAKLVHAARCRLVADLGCGTGMISYAIALLANSYIIGIDIDTDAIYDALASTLWETLGSTIDYIVGDALRPPLRKIDCAVSNPPFGTKKRRRADTRFLSAALQLNPRELLFIHPSNASLATKIEKMCSEKDYESLVLGEAVLLIRNTYAHHFKRLHRVKAMIISCRSRLAD